MWASIVAAMLLAAAPERAIAVQWRGAEAPDARARLAVREALAAVDGRPVELVIDRALERARVAVSREHPAAIRALHGEVRTGLDEADAAYREARFADAQALLAQTLAQLRAHPELPGAAASAREAHLLTARIAWASADPDAAEQALAAALRLDPEARLAARRAPPELIARYEAQQAALLGARETGWITARLRLAEGSLVDVEVGAEIEIDGAAGLRPVPPGPHFIVVFRAGHEIVASFRELDDEWLVPAARERISTDPDDASGHEAVCAALGLAQLVLAERRGAELGLQSYRCGVGYGPAWTGKREQLPAGAAAALAGPFDARAPSLAEPWTHRTSAAPAPAPDPDPERGKNPWYRRGWIWGTGAGVAAAIVGGVVTGVVLGGRDSPAPVEIDADDFIGAAGRP